MLAFFICDIYTYSKAFGMHTYAVSYIRDATIYRYTYCHIMIHQAVIHTYIPINTHLGRIDIFILMYCRQNVYLYKIIQLML